LALPGVHQDFELPDRKSFFEALGNVAAQAFQKPLFSGRGRRGVVMVFLALDEGDFKAFDLDYDLRLFSLFRLQAFHKACVLRGLARHRLSHFCGLHRDMFGYVERFCNVPQQHYQISKFGAGT
jgi:hypothetical protein